MNLDDIAQEVNSNYERMQRGTKLLLDIALRSGELLAEARGKVQELDSSTGEFDKWVLENFQFKVSTAYNYIKLFEYKNQITAENLAEAYKQIETLEEQKKQTEKQKAYQRVAEFRKTGKKPEGWRQHTDDNLVKEEEQRDARIEENNQTILKNKQEKQQQEENKKYEKTETESLLNFLDQHIETEKKRTEFKEKIRLSADGMKDPFQDALMDYLNGLENDNRRIEACYNIIKICKKVAVELQSKDKKV